METSRSDDCPVAPLMILLCAVAWTEGADNGIFPAITKALENTVQFDVATLGSMAMVQLLFQAAAGPFWGILASRGIMTRTRILALGTFMQGLTTLIMWIFIENYYALLLLRAINGICLGSLRPIANSIVGDRFEDGERGKYFGYILFSFFAGQGFVTLVALLVSEEVFFPALPTFWGWKLSFVLIGMVSMALAPAILLFLPALPVKQKVDSSTERATGGVGKEFQRLRELLKVPTFAILVFQGCFGLIPWRAMDFRIFYFQTVGVGKAEVGTILALGGVGGAIGSLFGGYIGDALNKWWPMHGRVLAAEISVYGGIPIAFLTFMVVPSPSAYFVWYGGLSFALNLICLWTPSSTNNPILCQLAGEEERCLVLAWQTSLEGAIGSLGPLIFTLLLSNVFGYDPECNKEENQELPDCQNIQAAAAALVFTSCVPWAICGIMYSTLHVQYPRDLKALQDKRELSGQIELAGGLIVSS